MFLSEKYKAVSFPQQYYRIDEAPFILMRINPESNLGWLLWGKDEGISVVDDVMISYDDETKCLKDNLLPDDWPWSEVDDDFISEIYENEVEFLELLKNYVSIIQEIKHSDLVLKADVKGFVAKDKLIDYWKSTRESARCEPKDVSESELNSMLKLIIGMAIDAYGYNPNSPRNSATGDKNGISAKILSKCGISISDDTIRKYLNEAKKLL